MRPELNNMSPEFVQLFSAGWFFTGYIWLWVEALNKDRQYLIDYDDRRLEDEIIRRSRTFWFCTKRWDRFSKAYVKFLMARQVQAHLIEEADITLGESHFYTRSGSEYVDILPDSAVLIQECQKFDNIFFVLYHTLNGEHTQFGINARHFIGEEERLIRQRFPGGGPDAAIAALEQVRAQRLQQFRTGRQPGILEVSELVDKKKRELFTQSQIFVAMRQRGANSDELGVQRNYCQELSAECDKLTERATNAQRAYEQDRRNIEIFIEDRIQNEVRVHLKKIKALQKVAELARQFPNHYFQQLQDLLTTGMTGLIAKVRAFTNTISAKGINAQNNHIVNRWNNLTNNLDAIVAECGNIAQHLHRRRIRDEQLTPTITVEGLNGLLAPGLDADPDQLGHDGGYGVGNG